MHFNLLIHVCWDLVYGSKRQDIKGHKVIQLKFIIPVIDGVGMKIISNVALKIINAADFCRMGDFGNVPIPVATQSFDLKQSSTWF
jgi:hypothetical protein